LDFGKSSENHQRAAFLHPADGRRGLGDELVIGLVEDKQGASGKFFHKGGEFCVGDSSPGGVVRRSEEDQSDVLFQTGRKSGEVVMEISVGDLFKGNPKESGHKTVDGECIGGSKNPTLAGLREGVVAKLDNFIRAATENNMVAGESVGSSDGVAKGESGTVGIEVGVLEGVADSLKGAGGGSEGILV